MAQSPNRPFPAAPVALALFGLYCVICLFLPPGYNEHSFLASIIDKHCALERARSPKIVFVGGSNLALGLDSDSISRSTGRDVVNMGVSRLFGLRYCLEEIKDDVKTGDTVVVVPEYENFFGEMNGSAHLMNVPLLMPRAVNWVLRSYSSSPERVGAMLRDGAGVLTFKWNWWKSHLLSFILAPKLPLALTGAINPSEPEHFTRENFNSHGDFVGHLGVSPPAHKYMKLCNGLAKTIDPEAANVLNEFNRIAIARGAQVVLMPPPLPRLVYRLHKDQVDAVYQYCRAHLDFPVVAPPWRYVFANRNFFNSLYHLNGDARTERTRLVLQDLESHAQTAEKPRPVGFGL